MNSLIDMDGMGDFFINLTNKFADGISWLANRKTLNKRALDIYVEEIEKSDLEPLEKAIKISNAKKAIKEYGNQNSILEIAAQNAKETAKPQEVDEDWLNQFMDKARLVSDAEFQLIWGKILAEECNETNSIPKILLHILEQMDKNDAKVFSKICEHSVYVEGEYFPMIFYRQCKEYFLDMGINYSSLADLQALGLIEFNVGESDSHYCTTCQSTPAKIIFNDKSVELPEGMKSFSTGNVIFTKAGRALSKAIKILGNEEFWQEHCTYFLEEDIELYYEGIEEEAEYRDEVIEAMEEAKRISGDTNVKGYADFEDAMTELDK